MANQGVESLHVEVVYGDAHEQVLLAVAVAPGATLQDAIVASGILARFPEIDLEKQAVGVFSEIRSLDATLCTGDRVEIYRPLTADPKELRRARARRQRPN